MFETEKKALEEEKCVCAAKGGSDKPTHEGCALCPHREKASDNVARAQGANLYVDNHPGDTDEPLEPTYDGRKLEEE